jgi:hypothetical protein
MAGRSEAPLSFRPRATLDRCLSAIFDYPFTPSAKNSICSLRMPRTNGATLLDFKKTFNPYCSINTYVMCPIRLCENRLDFRVTAGETYSGHE